MAARSVIFISGFDGVSTHTSRVCGRSAARTSSSLVMSTYAGFEARFAEDFADHLAQSPVDVVGRDDVVAGLESLHQRRGDRQARRKHQRLLAAFEVGEAFLQRAAVRIALARIAEAERILALGRCVRTWWRGGSAA